MEFIVSVKDKSTGIDPEIFPRLFTKFVTKSDRGNWVRPLDMQKYY
jgi:signal transduction histidine kinase